MTTCCVRMREIAFRREGALPLLIAIGAIMNGEGRTEGSRSGKRCRIDISGIKRTARCLVVATY